MVEASGSLLQSFTRKLLNVKSKQDKKRGVQLLMEVLEVESFILKSQFDVQRYDSTIHTSDPHRR